MIKNDTLKDNAPALDNESVLGLGASWHEQGFGVALATVIETWGSAPRPVGSHLAIREDGLFMGSVSGGCVEGAVIEAAHEVISNQKSEILSFGVNDQMAWDVGLSCGGKIRIFVEPVI